MATEKRLIDAKALERQIKEAFKDSNPVLMGQMLRWVRKQTKVDAVEVVRCKDCKNRDEITGECKHPKAVGWDVIVPEDNDFCSYGERKDNG